MNIVLFSMSARIAIAIAAVVLGLATLIAVKRGRARFGAIVGIGVLAAIGALAGEGLVALTVKLAAPAATDFNEYRWVFLSPYGRWGLYIGLGAVGAIVALSWRASRGSSAWRRAILVALRGAAAHRRIEFGWDDYVVDGLGIRCVSDRPWVTGAETCELVLALDTVGEREKAVRLFGDMQHLRTPEGGYWTGYVYPDAVNWPAEHTTYTAAAVILAADALGEGSHGSDIMRGATLPAEFAEFGLECECRVSDEDVAGVS